MQDTEGKEGPAANPVAPGIYLTGLKLDTNAGHLGSKLTEKELVKKVIPHKMNRTGGNRRINGMGCKSMVCTWSEIVKSIVPIAVGRDRGGEFWMSRSL